MANSFDLVVFDLDFTLWDCGGTWCDCLSPPFRREGKGVFDRTDAEIVLYPDVLTILDFCDSAGCEMALASRTEQPAWARELLDLLGVSTRFPYQEIYPSSKLRHFDALHKSTGYEFERMLFFDDEMRNICEVGTLGVTSIYVESGVNESLFRQEFGKIE